MHVLEKVKKRFPAPTLRRRYQRKRISLHLHYGQRIALRLGLPEKLAKDVARLVGPWSHGDIDDLHGVVKCLQRLEQSGHDVTIYPDAEEFLEQRLFQQRMETLVAQLRKDPEHHPLRRELLKVELLPYQLDGIAFAVGAGRAVLADDMGLGKTIQGVGVAELLAREAGIRKVLVICPASLKSQWRAEVERFCERTCQLVLGSMASRAGQYDNESFFTICN
jgi:hypothetical protein